MIEIYKNLYQSGWISNTILEEIRSTGIEVVIDVSGGIDRRDLSEVIIEYHWVRMWDLPIIHLLPPMDVLWRMARITANAVIGGRKTLVHCTGSRNRSGLVIGCALTLLGMSGIEAIKLIRSKNPEALYNIAFSDYLEGIN